MHEMDRIIDEISDREEALLKEAGISADPPPPLEKEPRNTIVRLAAAEWLIADSSISKQYRAFLNRNDLGKATRVFDKRLKIAESLIKENNFQDRYDSLLTTMLGD